MLCWKPSVWPTSCATTYSISRPIRSSGSGSVLRARIERADLHEVPVARQVHDVVVELDVRLEDLAGARIVHVRARRVLGRRRQPADHRVARVLGAPVRILLRRRRFLRDDRVLEAGRFERRLPVSRCPSSCTAPTSSASPDRLVDDRLHRLGERGVRILLLEPLARDVAALAARGARRCRSRSALTRSSRRARRTGAASSASRAACTML